MDKKTEFYIYLIEKYAEYKKMSTPIVVAKLEELNLTDVVYEMYEKYHIEAIENAFQDIDRLIYEKENKSI